MNRNTTLLRRIAPQLIRVAGIALCIAIALPLQSKEVDKPAVENADEADKLPMEPLDGPPFVTAKSWVIIDGDSGKFLAGSDEDEKRDPASTTKIMTAYLVTSLAEKDPSVLDEMVTFTERADKTSGSTSDLKAGEKISVGELMYGLLLPSGNDASVALGEHFGKRLSPEKAAQDPKATSYDCFVDAMNRKAAEIGMTNTHFVNTHGLTTEGHQLTVRDLAHLAYLAFKQPEFRKRVGAARHRATVNSEDGHQRNVVWKNTNQLLKTQGYDGIKTGTTGAAGACLVSTAQREGCRLIVVILGSTSNESRYVDARNLYRWAWKDLIKLRDHGDDKKNASP
jgi:D-alanyl-D-alanine carboxypeptidase (penicillin-binding protein 5/6)